MYINPLFLLLISFFLIPCFTQAQTSGSFTNVHITNTSGGYDYGNYLRIQGATGNNDHYPGIEFKGGTYATSYPRIGLGNGGLLLLHSSGSSSTYAYPMKMYLSSSNTPSSAFASFEMFDGGVDRRVFSVYGNGRIAINKTSHPNALIDMTLPYGENGKILSMSRSNGAYGYHFGITEQSKFILYDNDGVTDRLAVLPSTGNVGIGTINPSEKFTVNGNIKGESGFYKNLVITNNVSGSNALSMFRSNSAYGYHFGITEQSKFVLYDNDGITDRLSVLPTSGNVGIGTTDPTEKLSVNGNIKAVEGKYKKVVITNTEGGFASANYLQIQGTTNNNYHYPGIELMGGDKATSYPNIVLTNGGLTLTQSGGWSATYNHQMRLNLASNSSPYAYANFEMSDGTSTKKLMSIMSSGKVGIGRENPTSQLEVALPAGQNGNIFTMSRSDNAYAYHFGISDNSRFIVFDNNGIIERFTILPETGNVGIGTTTPAEKLSVNGNIRSKKVIVSQTNWPDYVFDSSYSLRSLSLVENFIIQNKRLPDMPSAKEVEQNGISVGDNQALLLKKVEELTLYIIDLQKQINQLKKDSKK